MGHMDFPGCFRCHDGGHFLVKDGAVTSEVIPYTCDTCHTWPQIGGAVASLPLGEPPVTHDDSLWVFNHKDVATSVDPGGQDCGECHARDYCTNCHQTGAVNVEHDEMATNHAQAIRDEREPGLRLLPPAGLLRPLPRRAGPAGHHDHRHSESLCGTGGCPLAADRHRTGKRVRSRRCRRGDRCRRCRRGDRCGRAGWGDRRRAGRPLTVSPRSAGPAPP